jgi:hypothetical protein
MTARVKQQTLSQNQHLQPAPSAPRFCLNSHRKLFSTQNGTEPVPQMTAREYHKLADEFMDDLLDHLESFGESIDLPDYDVLYAV